MSEHDLIHVSNTYYLADFASRIFDTRYFKRIHVRHLKGNFLEVSQSNALLC